MLEVWAKDAAYSRQNNWMPHVSAVSSEDSALKILIRKIDDITNLIAKLIGLDMKDSTSPERKKKKKSKK